MKAILNSLLFCAFIGSFTAFANTSDTSLDATDASKVVDKLLHAYNQQDIDAFISYFDEDIRFYRYPNTVMFIGKKELIARYGVMFKTLKCLRSTVTQRMTKANIVIDHELSQACTTDPAIIDKQSDLLTSYEVNNQGKVIRVMFFAR